MILQVKCFGYTSNITIMIYIYIYSLPQKWIIWKNYITDEQISHIIKTIGYILCNALKNS